MKHTKSIHRGGLKKKKKVYLFLEFKYIKSLWLFYAQFARL